MPAGVLRLSDVIVPAVFVPMVRRLAVEKTALIQSGAMVPDPLLDHFLAGPGLTIDMPKLNGLDRSDGENVSSDDPTVFSVPNKPATGDEIAVRLSRNNSWSEMDLVRALLAADPLAALADDVAQYWAYRRQKAAIAQLSGIFAYNALATDANHIQNSMTVDLSGLNGGKFADGQTNFHGSAFIDALVTMGDSMGGLALVAMHSIVYGNALKKNLIQFRLDSEANPTIPTYMGKDVTMDDSMPMPAAGVFETWLFGRGAMTYGTGSPAVPNEVIRVPAAGNGAGQSTMHDRVEWSHHVPGTAYVGTPAKGGPSNANTTNNLAAATSWRQVAPDRRQIPIARIVTREF
ncbi:hypothetical protein [Methylobacterium fujisawaense]|uniref:hypothetical protein n=1 Tax=Methylobacterium fujisawaense TaxID=107400 RepID=UPI002447DC67|nr:hypothetical protein [Methylobacterium fujisawaense]MDH3027633.1 hypothetical protein [Methylobacterium fujisawaense]